MKLIVMTAFSLLIASTGFCFEDVLQAKPGEHGSSKNIKCPIEVVPGQSLGPIELGRHRAEIEGLGLEMKTVQGSKQTMIVGRYHVGFDDAGKVHLVEAEIGDLPNCLTFGAKKIRKKMSAAQLAKVFKNCKPEEMRKGGNLIECEGIYISTGGWGGHQKTPALKILSAQP